MTDKLRSELEGGTLKLGYAASFQERWPMNTDTANCFTPESAYFLELEKEYLRIPKELQFHNLESEIPEKHRERMAAIWRQVQKHKSKLALNAAALINCWDKAPEAADQRVHDVMEHTPFLVQERFRRAMAAIITDTPYTEICEPTDLQMWQVHDKAIRFLLYEEHKNYIVALRLYYEMLLERSRDGSEFVLPVGHEQRDSIMIRNRYLRLIDATYQAISAAKAAHHQQAKGRLRKTEEKPYVTHAFDVTFDTLLDVIPFIAEEEFLDHNPVIFGLIGPIHDIIEDTRLTIHGLIDGFLWRLADKYDSSLDPVIQGGFGDNSDDIKSKKLDLMSGKIRTTLVHIMRILSNNTELTDAEKKTAMAQNIAGREKTMLSLNVNFGHMRNWGIAPPDTTPLKHTFQQFPEEYDGGKLTKFLIRLNAITGRDKRRQQTLIIKLEDRANNIGTLNGRPAAKRIKYLRATVTRLIAWVMLDHDQSQYPLYNSLPRLINVTMETYEQLARENPETIEQADTEYMAKLKQWQLEVKVWELPRYIQAVLAEYAVDHE